MRGSIDFVYGVGEDEVFFVGFFGLFFVVEFFLRVRSLGMVFRYFG